MRSTALSPPAKARCSSSMRARASRRRRSPTSIRRLDNNHEIVPVLNKVDLPAAEPDKVKQQIEDVIGLDGVRRHPDPAKPESIVPEVLEAIVSACRRQRPTTDAAEGAARRQCTTPIPAWSCWSASSTASEKRPAHRHDGLDALTKSDRAVCSRPSASSSSRLWARRDRLHHRRDQGSARTPASATRSPTRAGRSPRRYPASARHAGGVRGLFPADAADFEAIPCRHGQARLNDVSFSVRDGDLGGARLRLPLRLLASLHLRSSRSGAARVQSQPGSSRRLGDLQDHLTQGNTSNSQSGRHARSGEIAEIQEPWIAATILTPDEYLGAVLELCQDRRGEQQELTYVGTGAW